MEKQLGISLISSDLHNDSLNQLIESVAQKTVYPAKTIFTRPGDPMNMIYYIEHGRTKHYIYNIDGSVKILYYLSSGWFFGETPVFLSCPTGLYSETDVKTSLSRISIKDCYDLMAENKLFRDRLLYSMASKTLTLRNEVENLTFNSCKSRIQRLFCSLADNRRLINGEWYELKVHYTHSQLGEIIGCARVTVSRIMNDLCAEGFIRITNRHIQINAEKYNELILTDSLLPAGSC